jgi:predicted RNase H-like nuclease
MGSRYIVVGKHDDGDDVDDVDRDICSQVLIGTFRMPQEHRKMHIQSVSGNMITPKIDVMQKKHRRLI